MSRNQRGVSLWLRTTCAVIAIGELVYRQSFGRCGTCVINNAYSYDYAGLRLNDTDGTTAENEASKLRLDSGGIKVYAQWGV